MASLLQKVGHNILGFFGGKAAAAVAGIFLLRALGPEAAGRYGAAVGFAGLFQALGDLGLEQALAQAVSREPERANHWWSMALALLGWQSLAVSLALGAFLWAGGSGPIPAGLVVLAFITTRVVAFGTLTGAALRGLDRFGLQGALITATSLMNAAALLALLVLGHASPAAALWATLGSGLAGLVAWGVAGRRAGLRWRGAPWAELATFGRQSLPFSLMAVATLFYLRVDQSLLASMVGPRPLGYYVAAARINDLLLFSLAALYAPLFVQFSGIHGRLRAGDEAAKRQAGQSLSRAVRYMAALCLPLGVGGSVLAGPLIHWLYGDAFAPATLALAMLVWVPALAGIHGGLLSTIAATGGIKTMVRFTGLNLLLNVALNVALIPRWGIEASAAISVLGELARLAFAASLCRQRGLAPSWKRALWPALPAALGMGAALLWLGPAFGGLRAEWRLAAQLGAGMLAYGALMLALGCVGEDERGLWQRLRRRAA